MPSNRRMIALRLPAEAFAVVEAMALEQHRSLGKMAELLLLSVLQSPDPPSVLKGVSHGKSRRK